MNQVKISVIVPVFNAATTIEYTVGSILSPTFFEDCELILVDDGSTDGSAEKCDRMADIHECIRVIHRKNGGVSSARNEGVKMAAGEYVTFVDSDDILPKNCLADWLVTISADDSVDLYVGGYRLLNGSPIAPAPEQSRLYGHGELSEFIDDNLCDNGSYLRPVWGKLFRKSLIDRHSLRFEPSLSYGEDMLFLFRFLLRCNAVGTVSRCTYIYRSGASGLSSDLCSDRHITQLLMLLGPYSETLRELESAFPESVKIKSLCHRDLVGRLICRILTVFATRRTLLCTSDNISRLYHYMSSDSSVNRCGGAFSLRAGQIPNLLLYRIGSPSFSARFYRASAIFCTVFGIRPKRY